MASSVLPGSSEIRLVWQGRYLSGQSAGSESTEIRLYHTGLKMTVGTGTSLWWLYSDIKQTQGALRGEQVRLERGEDQPEILVINDPRFLDSVKKFAPDDTAHFRAQPRRTNLKPVAVAVGTIAGLLVLFYWWGIPAAASYAARHVPASWEVELGRSSFNQQTHPAVRCKNEELNEAVSQVLAALTSTVPDSPYRFHIAVVNNPQVNAFAMPGGFVVVFRGLLERTESPEELAGVLAHETQHVYLRHTTRALIQQASLGLMFSALTGDAGRIGAFGLEVSHALASMQYSRHNEREADEAGLRMMATARIDPSGMIRFFRTMEQLDQGQSGPFLYFSSHPGTADRIKNLETELASWEGEWQPLLPAVDWSSLKMAFE